MNLFERGPMGEIGSVPSEPLLLIPPARPKPTRWEVWRGRILLILLVLFSLELGIVLTIAPWTPFWTSSSLLSGFPELRFFLMHNFVRGLVSGLGLTDIWLAVSEAVRYREFGN